MTETAAAPVTSKAAKAKVPRTKPAHPPTNEMVHSAIKSLKERGGSSLVAVKKYIAANYKVDVEKLAPFIKRALKSGVAKGDLVQAKGKGASGSFKVAAKDKPAKKVAKSPKKKPTAAKPKQSPKKAAKKTTKKVTASKPKQSPKKALKKTTKAKKVAKSPAKKPKAPKAKKTPAKKVATKKVAAKK